MFPYLQKNLKIYFSRRKRTNASAGKARPKRKQVLKKQVFPSDPIYGKTKVAEDLAVDSPWL
jgi:hypothetical protein